MLTIYVAQKLTMHDKSVISVFITGIIFNRLLEID